MARLSVKGIAFDMYGTVVDVGAVAGVFVSFVTDFKEPIFSFLRWESQAQP